MFGFTPCSIEREVLLLVYPSSVAQIVHSVTLEVVLLSVSSSLADIVGLFYGRRKNGDTKTKAQTVPVNIFRGLMPSLMATWPGFPILSCDIQTRTVLGSCINCLKLLASWPLQKVKQIEGCSEIQHLRNCGSDVRSNRGPAR